MIRGRPGVNKGTLHPLTVPELRTLSPGGCGPWGIFSFLRRDLAEYGFFVARTWPN